MLVGVKLRALGNRHNQKMIWIPVLVPALNRFGRYHDRRSAVIKGDTENVVDIVGICVYTRYISIVLNTNDKCAAICVGEGYDMIG